MAIKTNCPNCGAPVCLETAHCPYCGTPYFQQTNIAEETAAQLIGDNAKESLDTLSELVGYIKNSIYTPNEARAIMGLPPKED